MNGYETVTLTDWDKVREFSDRCYHFTPSYLERAVAIDLPHDVFSAGQIASKAWLMNNFPFKVIEDPTVAILGCWCGTLVEPVIDASNPRRVYGFDIDPYSIQKAEEFNQKHVENDWMFKGVVADVNTLTTSSMTFETAGELISVRPDIVINTSAEHMSNEWFETADINQLIIVQSNNNPDLDGHINACKDMEEFLEKYPMSTVYSGEMITPSYTRFMAIGYPS